MWRKLAKAAAPVAAAVALPAIVGVIGAAGATDDVYPPRDPREAVVPQASSTRIDPGRPTVAIALGPDGANVADTLAPFEVFAATDRFNVLTVAPSPEPVTLTGGLDLMPDLTFAQLDSLLPQPPEVIVVPQIHGSTSEVADWIDEQRREGAPLLMSVCVGASVLAEMGLLDGRPATSHWLKLIGLRRSHPKVHWTGGVRFVDDGDLITTAGVLSGVDGALRVVERLVGPSQAERVAQDLLWPGYRPGGSIATEELSPATADLVALLSATYRWGKPTTGVLLTDGVGEIELASAFRPYTELSYLARLEAVSTDGEPVRSRNGLLFVPRSGLEPAPDVDRILVPGDPTEAETGLAAAGPAPLVPLHRPGEFPFDGALRDIAEVYDDATARWVAKSLQYPVAADTPEGRAWPWTLTIRPILLALVGFGAVLLLGRLRSSPRRTALERRRGPDNARPRT